MGPVARRWSGWLAWALCMIAAPAAGQSRRAPDTTRTARPDSAAPARPTNDPFVTGVYHPGDYVRERSGPSVARGDVTGVYFPELPAPPAGADSGGEGSARTAKDSVVAKNAPVAPIPEPVIAACGKAAAGTEAPGLLAVLFRPDASDAERTAVAKQAGATLAGRSPLGDDYVSFPATSSPNAAVADRLARLPRVSQISPVPCPGPARIAAYRAAHGAPCPAKPDSAAAAGRERAKPEATK